ncbi:hypothetical protein BDW66DRAFT_149876 [Aspergillus desertorum]
MSETAPRVRSAESGAPQTPKAKRGTTKRTVEFVNYTGERSSINPDDPIQIDKKIKEIFGKPIANPDKRVKYLYVFSRKGTKGMYKIGLTHDIFQRKKELESCYEELELHCYVECPNVHLFESVAHAELLQYRRKHSCPYHSPKANGAETEHTEWFEADLQVILDTVTAWSLYARMLYRCGLTLDGNNHSVQIPGASQRSDRWRRWALKEAGRWMDGVSSKVSVVGEKAMPEQVIETDAADETASEPESTFSSPADFSDTPGTTPATTPGTTPEPCGHEKDDYGLSPTPAGRYIMPGSLDIDDDDEDDVNNRPRQPVERDLFGRKKSLPTMRQKSLSSDDCQSLRSTRDGNTQISDAEPVPDTRIRALLTQDLYLTENPGTIYLTKHTERESYKIYHRKKGSPRKRSECYTQQKPYWEIECTNTLGIQNLVLAEFADWTTSHECGACNKSHNNWIEAPGERISESLRAWTDLVEVGCDYTEFSFDLLSQDVDRWTKWAREAVAKGREAKCKQKEAQEDESFSAVDRTSVEEPRQISRTETDAASEGNSKDSGRGGQGPTNVIPNGGNGKSGFGRASWSKAVGWKTFWDVFRALVR